MTKLAQNHLTNDLLVRALDDEVSPPEAAQVALHLSQCDECQQRLATFRAISERVESLSSSITPVPAPLGRELLAQRLNNRPSETLPPPAKVLRRFGWGMALAAALALGIVFAPARVHPGNQVPAETSSRSSIDTFEVNGEKFVALPYSNPDLPVSTSQVVRMQIPVSSLTDAGVALELISMQDEALNQSVLANVLVGMDGQPLGVHVLSAE